MKIQGSRKTQLVQYGSQTTGEKMVTVDEAIIARYEKEGKHFEILVDPAIAYDLKEGKIVSLSKMLAVNEVFTDSKKGTRASASDVEQTFGTIDMEKISETIVKKGDIQLTTEFRRKKTEERRKQIAAFISRNAVNPKTGVPHPQERIMAAMSQAKVNIDPMHPADQQVDAVVNKIKEIIPISMEQATLTVEIPAQYAGKAYGALKELHPSKEQWLSNGSLVAQITVPAGMKENIFRKLGSLTNGEAKIEEKQEKK